jgi:hypothetical protein
MTYKATVGTISHGTLRAADLLESFTDELARLEPGNDLIDEARAVITLDRAGWSNLVDSEEASDLLTSLVDALNEHAPVYCYFGTTDGDGSDFGFWPSMEAIEELPRIQNVAGEDLPDEDHCYVNDHGNVTVYAADGTVILELV